MVQHRLHLGSAWTVSVTEVSGPGEAQILLSDAGRASLLGMVEAGLDQDRRVLVADVFGTGEAQFPSGSQMTLGAVGERALGILVGQILALVKWESGRKRGKVRLGAVGPVTAFAGLCAAALEPGRLSHLYLDGMYSSLKRLLDLPVLYDSAVPLFCFGLLREADVPELLAMTEAVPVEWLNHGPVKPVVGRDT